MKHTYVCLWQCSLFSFRNRLMCGGKSHQTFCALGAVLGPETENGGWGELSNESAEGGFCHLLPSELQQAVGPWKKAAEQSQDVMAKGSTIYINLQVMALNSCKYGIIMRYLQLLIGFIWVSYFVDPIPLLIWHLTSYINLGCRML